MGIGKYGFFLGLKKNQRGNDSILVVVDGFIKMPHFITCYKTSDATHVLIFFFNEIILLLGFLKSIISDRDTRFTGEFWRTLWKKLGTKLNFNSAYHPQFDGQTEVVNKILGNILRSLAGDHPKKWDCVLA